MPAHVIQALHRELEDVDARLARCQQLARKMRDHPTATPTTGRAVIAPPMHRGSLPPED